jgi:hypothetical protein
VHHLLLDVPVNLLLINHYQISPLMLLINDPAVQAGHYHLNLVQLIVQVHLCGSIKAKEAAGVRHQVQNVLNCGHMNFDLCCHL